MAVENKKITAMRNDADNGCMRGKKDEDNHGEREKPNSQRPPSSLHRRERRSTRI